jgi:hypothetical protein
VINLVFVELDRAQIGMLRSGALGAAFLAASMIFLLWSILYCGNAPSARAAQMSKYAPV